MKCFLQIVVAVLLFAGPVNAQLLNEQGFKFMRLFDWVNSRYVDSVNLDKFSDEIIRESLHKLDPHSVYFTKKEFMEINEPMQGNFEGIGVNFYVLNDTIYILTTIAGGPSEKAGVKPGDRIIRIQGENVAGIGITTKQITSRLKGRKGTLVDVDVKRKGVNGLLHISINRDKIPLFSIDAVYKVDSTIGYIRLSRFSQTTRQELVEALTRFKKDNISNLILDLSGNGGGYLEVATAIADEFLEANKLIVYTQGEHSEKKESFSTPKGLFEKGKLVIIIDEGSASASEIVAGAIQDWDRGIIVGRRSFGKGLVQSQFMFPDSSALRLTVARYYTPSGRLIQKPYSNGYTEYNKEVGKRYKSGELVSKDSIRFSDSLRFYTLVRKRVVYGGGGIMPDVFVPLDTNMYSGYYRTLLSRGVLTSFMILYVDGHRDELRAKYPNMAAFKSAFEVDEGMLKDLFKYAEGKLIPSNLPEANRSRKLLVNYMKASIAKELWGTREYNEIINEMEPCFQKAADVMNRWEMYYSNK